MIKGMHAMFYSSEPEQIRAFIRDKLGLGATDIGGGWLIFDVPEADLGCHPAGDASGKRAGAHDISFYCDDLEKTVAELTSRGVEFTAPITDAGYGMVTRLSMPGGVEVELYQPKYRKGGGSGVG